MLLDDRKARRAAKNLGVHIVGTAGVLVLAKRRGLVATIRPDLDALAGVGFFLDSALVDQVLLDAGESVDTDRT